jgi:hypothetical protein
MLKVLRHVVIAMKNYQYLLFLCVNVNVQTVVAIDNYITYVKHVRIINLLCKEQLLKVKLLQRHTDKALQVELELNETETYVRSVTDKLHLSG